MTDADFSEEDRESLVAWLQGRGGSREQAEFAARQLLKRARMDAAERGVAPIEAMGVLLQKVARAGQLMEESLGEAPEDRSQEERGDPS